jgi:L-asparaginase II
MSELLVESLRGGRRETVHPVSASLVEDGQVRWSVGDDLASYWRSASKPFQLETSLAHLPSAAVASLSDRELAIGAASHSGEEGHVDTVRGLLARFGGDASELQCGAHPPVHEPTARQVPVPTNLHSNCSGKHAFMLAASRHAGFPLDYRGAEHPLQRANLARLDELASVRHELAIDGCSVPTFFAPLSAMARAWSRLAEAMADEAGSLGRIGWAMHREPWFTSGTDRFDRAVVSTASEPLAAKIGAEGVFCIALPKRRVGLALKCHTGNGDALAVAVRAALREHGVTLAGDFPWERVSNVRGVRVGERRAIWR